VFKTRAVGSRLAGAKPTVFRNRTLTVQTMTYTVGQGSNLFLLPEPAQLFRDASYNQIQKFNLDPSSSLVLIDSITAGRQSQDEEWDFSRYYSMNQVRVQGKLVANDVLLLQDQTEEQIRACLPTRTLRDQLAPYSCYAMVILYGPLVQDTIRDIAKQYDSLVVFQQRTPEDCIWSFSSLDTFSPTNQAAIVRVAGKEAEMVRSRLRDILRQLEHIVGVDVFRRAFT
jgi:urease accessory protein